MDTPKLFALCDDETEEPVAWGMEFPDHAITYQPCDDGGRAWGSHGSAEEAEDLYNFGWDVHLVRP